MASVAPSSFPLRPSSPPAAPPLRAKSLGKLRHPLRVKAREYGAKSLYAAAKDVSDAELGRNVSLAREEGPCVRSGALVLTAAETGLLLPFQVSVRHLVDVLKERTVRECLGAQANAERLLCLRLGLALLDIIVATTTDSTAGVFSQLLDVIKDHIDREVAALTDGDAAVAKERALRLRLALTHVDALLVTLG